jgi:hypothetical protein
MIVDPTTNSIGTSPLTGEVGRGCAARSISLEEVKRNAAGVSQRRVLSSGE